MPSPITLTIDADACPVKPEVYRVAERFYARCTALKVVVVTNSPIAVPRDQAADFRPNSMCPGLVGSALCFRSCIAAVG